MDVQIKIDLDKIIKQVIKDDGIEKVLDLVLHSGVSDCDFNDALIWLEDNHDLITRV